MDKLGQQINVGDYVIIISKGKWGAVYFKVDVVFRMTNAYTFFGNPEDNNRTKHDNLIVITEQQMTSFVNKSFDMFPDPIVKQIRVEKKLQELQELRNYILGAG